MSTRKQIKREKVKLILNFNELMNQVFLKKQAEFLEKRIQLARLQMEMDRTHLELLEDKIKQTGGFR